MLKLQTITYTTADGVVVGVSRNISESALRLLMKMTLIDLAQKMVFKDLEPDKDFPDYKVMYARTQVHKKADEFWQALAETKTASVGNITMVLS